MLKTIKQLEQRRAREIMGKEVKKMEDMKKECINQGVEVPDQYTLRNKQLKDIETEIYKLFDENEVTFLEYQKIISSISFSLREASVFTLSKLNK